MPNCRDAKLLQRPIRSPTASRRHKPWAGDRVCAPELAFCSLQAVDAPNPLSGYV